MQKYWKQILGSFIAIVFVIYKATVLNIIWAGINETEAWIGLFPILQQVPHDAIIQISGWHTYWYLQ